MKMKLTKYLLGLFILTGVTMNSCKKFVEVPNPANQVISQTAFADDKSATATINGIYSAMMSNPQSICSTVASLYPAMSADELTYFTTTTRDGFIQNTLGPNNNTELESYLWTPAYSFIYAANSCLAGVSKSNSLSAPIKADISGEAYFVRAFLYFNLVNLFGDVPLVTSTDYTINKSMARTPSAQVYDLIIKDLLNAKALLKNDYPSDGRARPNKSAVQTLLAKVYLFQKDWKDAASLCDSIISNSNYVLENDLNNVFLTTSREAIWQLAPVTANYNTYVGNLILPSSASSAPTYLAANSLVNDFENGDNRKTAWLKSRVYKGQTLFYPYKYKIKTGTVVTEYNMVFRLAEVYLMRAEANAMLGNLTSASSDISVIRQRAGLPALADGLTQSAILSSVMHERRIELFSEWANRWFDLKRNNLADAVLGALKPSWKPTAKLYPIPYSQIVTNPALTQNEGY